MNYYFITGSSSGIGKALAQELLNYPDNFVFGISRSNHLSEKQFIHYKLDLSKELDVNRFNFEILEHPNKIVLINNAGTLGDIAHVGEQNSQNIIDSIMVNFTSASVLMNKFIKQYQELDLEKVIINISSGAATSPYDGWANYCSTKAALNMYTQVVHEEQRLKKYPIQSYAIAPGVVDTLMQDTIRKVDASNFSNIEKFKSLKENKDLYRAEDVAKKLCKMIKQTETIPSLISRIKL